MRSSDLVSELVESTTFSKQEGVEQIRGGVCHAAARPQMNHSLVSIIKKKKKTNLLYVVRCIENLPSIGNI